MSDQLKDAKRTKVLWLTSSYPRNEDDSASIFLRYLAEALANRELDLLVLAPDHPEVRPFPQPSGLVCRHFRYFFPRRLQLLAYGSGILPNLRSAPWLYLQVPFFILSMFIAAAWTLLKQRPALIHAHWIFPQGTVAVLLGKLFRIPVIVTAHGGDAFALKGRLLGSVKRWTIKNCSSWTSNTKATSLVFGAGLPEPHVIPMGIDYQRFASGRREALIGLLKPEKLVLLFVGRLVEKKGVADLLEAYSTITNVLRVKTELWIIGDGVERKKLEELVENLSLAELVRFFGRMPNKFLPDYYAAADIFIAPSIIDKQGDTEGQGVILLEAMAAGVPLIATNVGGVSDIVKNGKSGVLINPNNPTELKNAIEWLIMDPKARSYFRRQGQALSINYDWDLISEKFTKVYFKLIT
ncbi:glycosyltransferase [Methylomonas sp. HW2-6]|uniref:glycosyltransferase n=1 Tax=Methylomonas sp. HW2-6 TaxID=3376687 RepID=UPI0040427540